VTHAPPGEIAENKIGPGDKRERNTDRDPDHDRDHPFAVFADRDGQKPVIDSAGVMLRESSGKVNANTFDRSQ